MKINYQEGELKMDEEMKKVAKLLDVRVKENNCRYYTAWDMYMSKEERNGYSFSDVMDYVNSGH